MTDNTQDNSRIFRGDGVELDKDTMRPLDSQSELTYGYDPASPDGDYSALTIKHKDNFHNFVGDEADAIEAYVTTRVKEAERLARARGIEWGIDTAYTILDPLIENGYEAHQHIEKLKTSLTTTTNGKGE